jgi:hypothetical protein
MPWNDVGGLRELVLGDAGALAHETPYQDRTDDGRREAGHHDAGQPRGKEDHHDEAADQNDALPEKLGNGHDEGVLQLRQIREHAAGQFAHLLLAEEGHRHFREMVEKAAAQVREAILADGVKEQRLVIGHDRLHEEDDGHEQREVERLDVVGAVDQVAGEERKEKAEHAGTDQHEESDI